MEPGEQGPPSSACAVASGTATARSPAAPAPGGRDPGPRPLPAPEPFPRPPRPRRGPSTLGLCAPTPMALRARVQPRGQGLPKDPHFPGPPGQLRPSADPTPDPRTWMRGRSRRREAAARGAGRRDAGTQAGRAGPQCSSALRPPPAARIPAPRAGLTAAATPSPHPPPPPRCVSHTPLAHLPKDQPLPLSPSYPPSPLPPPLPLPIPPFPPLGFQGCITWSLDRPRVGQTRPQTHAQPGQARPPPAPVLPAPHAEPVTAHRAGCSPWA